MGIPKGIKVCLAFLLILCVCVGGVFACICLCFTIVPYVCGGQKRASEFLEKELQTVMSYHLGAENQIQILWKKATRALNCWTFAPAPKIDFYSE